MRLRSLGICALAALAAAASAAAAFQSSQQVDQAAIQTASVSPATGMQTPTCAGTNNYTFRWSASASGFVDSYSVYYGTATGGPYPTRAGSTSGATSLTVTLSGLATKTTYYFVVVAGARNWTSGDSNEVSYATAPRGRC